MKKTCFVIMPFGDKKDADGNTIDFDEVYDYLIKETVEDLGITCIRSDRIQEAGLIHKRMFTYIFEADVAVVDITSLNPNVLYELGVRHALANSVTIILRRKGTNIPFNINGITVIEYDISMKGVAEAKKNIKDYIENGLKSGKNDSPVHDALNLKIGTESERLTSTVYYNYRLKNNNKRIGVVTGDLRNIKDIDVWVNSENTNMQMSRYFELSVSGLIRYLGAKKKSGQIVEDLVADELATLVAKNASVPPGEIIVTGSHELLKTNNVKKIFHAASVIGQPGKGWFPIESLADCVRNAIVMADDEELKQFNLRSILFPLLGTGAGRGQLVPIATDLLRAAIDHLLRHPPCSIESVYFIVLRKIDLDACLRILDKSPELEAIKPLENA